VTPRAEREADSHGVGGALARAQPGGIDDALVRSRLLASLFGERVTAPRFGRFELRERIGQGGMGVVYRAWDPKLERAVAIKLVDTTGLDSSMRERALREARSLAKLAHPNVITIFEVGLADDCVWIAMEYVPGTTMRDWLARTPRPDDKAILRQWIAVGRGLIAVHEAGLVHRDVKPNNVLIGDDRRARLIDFGLVRGPGGGEELLSTTSDGSDSSGDSGDRVQTQGFVGTYAYAAPEQRGGGQVSAAADQYAFCVSVWESLCGARPPTIREDLELPARVKRALERGLAKDPEQRFPALEQLLDELESIIDGPSRRLGLLLGAAALGALVAGTAVAQLREPTEVPQLCAVDHGALAGTWDDSRRAALRQRGSASELEFAVTSLAALERGFDAWAVRWLDARRAACVATRIEGVQSEAALDLRNACLERKRRALQVMLDTLLEVDGLAAQAPAILATLPKIDDCADPERLAQIDPLPEPGPQRDAIARGHDVLAQARTLTATGALEQAQARVDEFAAEFADALEHAPLRLEFDAFPAQLEILRERTGRGVPKLVALAREAEGRRLDELAATLLVEAADAAAGRWSKPELEQWLIDEAEAALRRLDRPSDSRDVALHVAQATLLAQAGRFEDALAGHERARVLAQELGDETRVESQRLRIAAMLALLGRFDAARTTLESGRDAARDRWGPGAPAVGDFEFDLALLAIDTGDFDTARTHLANAAAIARAAFGDDSLSLARSEFAWTKLDLVAGEFASGLARIDAAIAIYTRELGPDHELLGDLHDARGVLRFFTADLSGSIESYQAALAIRTSVLGPEHPLLAGLYSNLGESQLALGQIDEASASFDRALAILATSLPADHPDLAFPLKGRGQAALAGGRHAQAIVDLERALAQQLELGAEPLEIADLKFSLARALAGSEGRQSTRAKQLAREARADFAARGMQEQTAAVDAWLRG
jgi:tetratricopeptide (TPR) repeat protein